MSYLKTDQIKPKKKNKQQLNSEANKIIKTSDHWQKTNYCEMCGKHYPEHLLSPAHRHKRSWYKGDVKKLSNKKQWIKTDSECHSFIETKPYLTKLIFKQLRGKK